MGVALCIRLLSFVWRSICLARKLLKEGLIWRMGDGKEVKIGNDKWLPTPMTYSIQSPRRMLAEDAKVVELIDPDTKWWNTFLIKEIFKEDKVAIIFQIPLSQYRQQDMVIWRCTTSGEFTVQSAYHMEKEKQELKQGEVQKPRDVVESERKLGV